MAYGDEIDPIDETSDTATATEQQPVTEAPPISESEKVDQEARKKYNEITERLPSEQAKYEQLTSVIPTEKQGVWRDMQGNVMGSFESRNANSLDFQMANTLKQRIAAKDQVDHYGMVMGYTPEQLKRKRELQNQRDRLFQEYAAHRWDAKQAKWYDTQITEEENHILPSWQKRPPTPQEKFEQGLVTNPRTGEQFTTDDKKGNPKPLKERVTAAQYVKMITDYKSVNLTATDEEARIAIQGAINAFQEFQGHLSGVAGPNAGKTPPPQGDPNALSIIPPPPTKSFGRKVKYVLFGKSFADMKAEVDARNKGLKTVSQEAGIAKPRAELLTEFMRLGGRKTPEGRAYADKYLRKE